MSVSPEEEALLRKLVDRDEVEHFMKRISYGDDVKTDVDDDDDDEDEYPYEWMSTIVRNAVHSANDGMNGS